MSSSELAGRNEPGNSTGICDVGYFNDEFAYGFDLPASASLVLVGDNLDSLFSAIWAIRLGDVAVTFKTFARADEGQPLTEQVSLLNGLIRAEGGEFWVESPIVLSSGDPAFVSSFVSASAWGTNVHFRVDAVKHNCYYQVFAVVPESAYTALAKTAMTDAVFSLCIE